jgi:hypothetical protein
MQVFFKHRIIESNNWTQGTSNYEKNYVIRRFEICRPLSALELAMLTDPIDKKEKRKKCTKYIIQNSVSFPVLNLLIFCCHE